MAKEISDKEILIDTVNKNTEALTKQTDILNHINDQLNKTAVQYGNFDKGITELKTYMKVSVGITSGIFVSILAGLFIYVLTK